MASPNTLRIQRPIGRRTRVPRTVQVIPGRKPEPGRNWRTTDLLCNPELTVRRNHPQRRRALKALRRAR